MNENAVSVFDSQLYSSVFSNADMKAIWNDQAVVQSWLDFEVALAKVQSEVGIIPAEALASIKQICHLDIIDWEELNQQTAFNGMAIKPVIDQLTHAGDEYVKSYLHWGGTTQDVLDTGQAIRLKSTLDLVLSQLEQLIEVLAKMADEHRHTVMVARTNSQDALPTTWGLQVSSYLSELIRHRQRVTELYPRACTGMFGGAIGNLSSLGDDVDGLMIRDRLLAALGLTVPNGAWNGSQDSIVEVVQVFALIHGSLVRMANDVELQGRSAIGELVEGAKGGASSTMPHKSNPRLANMIQSLSRLGWMYASGAPSLMDQQDIRAASMRVVSWSVVPEASVAVSTSLAKATEMMSTLGVNSVRMEKNFEHSRYMMMSESVMMALARKIGRGQSYQLVKQAIAEHSCQAKLLPAMMLECQEIRFHLSESEITQACYPSNYLGSNDQLIDEVLRSV
ncbi:adenylosuccinate lyase family protein [Photobacterium makurazakiensis]|uniref:class-II fumarase/aspartase family protein n=1 Tax=Photobacterium TaxID=657 RepID=UPI003D13E0C6